MKERLIIAFVLNALTNPLPVSAQQKIPVAVAANFISPMADNIELRYGY
jgi:hypothetical protein